uniref:PAC domain-containing protein n=1 Tax=mine drainage metagenome TaxID=410659 RepID=E6PVI8_9ZZZZ
MQAHFEQRTPDYTVEHRIRCKDGSTVWRGFVTDTTERKEAERQLRLPASVDDLTQLPNQRSFMARMEQELARLRSSPQARATVLIATSTLSSASTMATGMPGVIWSCSTLPPFCAVSCARTAGRRARSALLPRQIRPAYAARW